MKRGKTITKKQLIRVARLSGMVIVGIISFATSYFLLNKNSRTISNDEFKLYEQVAQSVFLQKNRELLSDISEGVNIEKSDTSITISSDDPNEFGCVVAKLQKGKLVYEHYSENEIKILVIQ